MNYSNKSHINTEADVKSFFHHLVDERKLNFHPDDDFADYISIDDKTRFSVQSAYYQQLNHQKSLLYLIVVKCTKLCTKIG